MSMRVACFIAWLLAIVVHCPLACAVDAPIAIDLATDEAPGPGFVDIGADRVRIRGSGGDVSSAFDQGTAVLWRMNEGRGAFVCRIASVENHGAGPQIGVTVRAGARGSGLALQLRHDARNGFGCLTRFERVTPGTGTGGGGEYVHTAVRHATALEGAWLRVRREWPEVHVDWSRDGKVWHEVLPERRAVLVEQPLYVGVHVVANGLPGVTAVFDSITLEEGKARRDASSLPPRHTWADRWTLTYTHAVGPLAFVALPEGIEKVRALFYTPGSKESVHRGRALRFSSSIEKAAELAGQPAPDTSGLEATADISGIRIPEGCLKLEGTFPLVDTELKPLTLWGVGRLGGIFRTDQLDAVLEHLAEVSGHPELTRVPLLPTGDSAAGGAVWNLRATIPDRLAACGPMLFGLSPPDGLSDASLGVPTLVTVGQHDGSHYTLGRTRLAGNFGAEALLTFAPMHRVKHNRRRTRALLFPFFEAMLETRLPDAAGGALRAIDFSSGWLADLSGYPTEWAAIRPIAEVKEIPRDPTWIPNRPLAHTWRALVSCRPRVVIRYPLYYGSSFGVNHVPTPDFPQTVLKAGDPFPVISSGPRDLRAVRYMYGDRPAQVVSGDGLDVVLAGLAPGSHSLHVETELADGRWESSQPVMIFVGPAEDGK